MSNTFYRVSLCIKGMILFVGVGILLVAHTDAAQAKPRPPVTILIYPIQPVSGPFDIKPGDSVELQAVVHTGIDVHELIVTVEPSGGASITAGDTSWTGTAAKNSDTKVRFTVRAPDQGQGSVRATVVVPGPDGAGLTSSTVYVLGAKPVLPKKASSQDQNIIRKNRDGRDVIEHPVK